MYKTSGVSHNSLRHRTLNCKLNLQKNWIASDTINIIYNQYLLHNMTIGEKACCRETRLSMVFCE